MRIEHCYGLIMPTPASIWFNITPTPRCQTVRRGRYGDIQVLQYFYFELFLYGGSFSCTLIICRARLIRWFVEYVQAEQLFCELSNFPIFLIFFIFSNFLKILPVRRLLSRCCILLRLWRSTANSCSVLTTWFLCVFSMCARTWCFCTRRTDGHNLQLFKVFPRSWNHL